MESQNQKLQERKNLVEIDIENDQTPKKIPQDTPEIREQSKF